MALASTGLAGYYFVAWLADDTVPGWASIVIPILILGSMQLIILGVIGEYVGLIYDSTRRLPPYVIQPTPDTRRRHRAVLGQDRSASPERRSPDNDQAADVELPRR